MELVITEQDFDRAGIKPEDIERLRLGQQVSSGPGDSNAVHKAVMDALPKALVAKVESIWNVIEGYEMASREVSVDVSGKPIGVGMEGKMKLRLERKKLTTDD